jgi:phenylpropionate dioxygenase-like ring-hydroxylating dioxygenase large terminal subunit
MWLYVRIILKYILKKKDVVVWAGLIWIWIETSGQNGRKFWVAERKLTSKGLSSMELVSWFGGFM